MFGNRKRKTRPDEDEPLVPHGLIWHATAEPKPQKKAQPISQHKLEPTTRTGTTPAPQERPKKDPFGPVVQYAEVLEMARRERVAPEAKQPQQPRPAEESRAGAPPLPWWRVRNSEPPQHQTRALKPMMLSTAEVPAIPPQAPTPIALPKGVGELNKPPALVSAITPTANQISTPPAAVSPGKKNDESPPLQFGRNLPAVASSSFSTFWSRTIEALHTSGSELWTAVISGYRAVRKTGARAWQSIDFEQNAHRAATRGQKLFSAGTTRAQEWAHHSQLSLKNASCLSLAYVHRIWLKGNLALSHARVHVPTRTRSDRLALQRIQARLAAMAFSTRIFFARQLPKWEMKRSDDAIDSRLWTSMTMAAICALLALAIVSLVPRYAAKSLPSRIVSANPSANTNVAPLANIHVPIGKNASPKKARPIQERPVRKQAAARPKPHGDDEEDYVAPDTYKYYGNRSKSSR
jgi:hypothetical protein